MKTRAGRLNAPEDNDSLAYLRQADATNHCVLNAFRSDVEIQIQLEIA